MSEGGRGEPLDLEPHLVLPSWLEECARGQVIPFCSGCDHVMLAADPGDVLYNTRLW